MTSQPDFIIDPSGNVRDVRHTEYRRQSVSMPRKPSTGSAGCGTGARVYAPVVNKPKKRPQVVLIPIGLILSAIVYLCSFCIAPLQKNRYSEHEIALLESGTRAFVRGEYQAALNDIDQVVRSKPRCREGYNRRGLVYYAMGDYDRAIEDLTKVIELSPDWSVGYSNRGAVYHSMGQYDRALDDLDQAIELDAKLGKAYHTRGLVHYAQGDDDAAIANLTQAIRLAEDRYVPFTPWTPGLERTRTAAQEDFMKNLQSRMEAEEDYMKLFQSTVDLPLAYTHRGLVYLRKGDLSQAAADLQKAQDLGLDPSFEQDVTALVPAPLFAPGASY